MLEDLKKGNITRLIFSKLARLARNTKELLEFSEIFNANNADRVSASFVIRAKLGKPISGQSPFGYRWVDKVLVPDPKEAPVRKLIYELYLEHKRLKTAARILNESGYRTRAGGEFSHMAIHRLITDPTAKGLRRANYTTRSSDKKAWLIKPKEEWIYTQCEPIVSEELWEKCTTLLASILEEERKTRYDMDKVYKLYLDEAISSEGFRERYNPLEERLKQILEGVPELQANVDFLKIQYLSSDQISGVTHD